MLRTRDFQGSLSSVGVHNDFSSRSLCFCIHLKEEESSEKSE